MEGLRQRLPALRRHAAVAISLSLLALPAAAGSLEQAKRIYDRLAGVPPSDTLLPTLKGMIDSDPANGPIAVANAAMNNKAFYNATLKNWITPWTNREGDKFAPLNDYTATVIGVIRDGRDYREILYENILYVGASGVVTPGNDPNSNAHYVALEANDVNLGDPTKLVLTTQSGVPAPATAGVMTTRAAARAFFIDGTNRAMFRFTLKNHLCNDLEQVQDTTRPSDRIRRDVPRSPGGDSRIFMNTCIGCHSGMDPMAQAFAFYDFRYDKVAADASSNPNVFKDAGSLTYRAAADVGHDPVHPNNPASPNGTEGKYHINESHFIEGYETLSEHWDNYWRSGPNTAIFGWGMGVGFNGTGSGDGAKSMGQELANSEAFAVCSVKKVFKAVCLRDPAEADRPQVEQMLTSFKTGGYKLKNTFAQAAVYCSGN